jgi:hypothetical protein
MCAAARNPKLQIYIRVTFRKLLLGAYVGTSIHFNLRLSAYWNVSFAGQVLPLQLDPGSVFVEIEESPSYVSFVLLIMTSASRDFF